MKTTIERRSLTRKDIALMLDVSVDAVRKNELAWGLGKARHDLNRRCVRYEGHRTLVILKKKGFLQ